MSPICRGPRPLSRSPLPPPPASVTDCPPNPYPVGEIGSDGNTVVRQASCQARLEKIAEKGGAGRVIVRLKCECTNNAPFLKLSVVCVCVCVSVCLSLCLSVSFFLPYFHSFIHSFIHSFSLFLCLSLFVCVCVCVCVWWVCVTDKPTKSELGPPKSVIENSNLAPPPPCVIARVFLPLPLPDVVSKPVSR